MTHPRRALISCLLGVGLLAACLPACLTEAAMPDEGSSEPEDLMDDEEKEAFDYANNPARVDETFLYLVHQLPVRGNARVQPWTAPYWPMYKDSLNHAWDGGQSPATKWAAAFGRAEVQERISVEHGVKSQTEARTCTNDSTCGGGACATSYDGQERRCIPVWRGICHGWAAAAIVEPAPTKPVTVPAANGNGSVTFYPSDLEGLMSLMYTDVDIKFLSSRCNKSEPVVDEAGRRIDGTCRDMNPGAWHVLLTNMLGLRKAGFITDISSEAEVWNHPLTSYEIVNEVDGRVPEISRGEAAAKLGLDASSTPLLSATKLGQGQWMIASMQPPPGTYTITMTGRGDADLYVKKGSEPSTTNYDCRPFATHANESCQVTVAPGDVIFVGVVGRSTESLLYISYGQPGAGRYDYNTAAERFFYVDQKFCYVFESDAARQPRPPTSYTNCRSLRYILETDAQGAILGGEWLESSRTSHPDFAWWAISAPRNHRAGGLIKYAEVKALLDQASNRTERGVTHVPLLTDEALGRDGTWTSRYATITVPAGTKSLTVQMSGTGDAQLYVRRGPTPTTTHHACKSDTAGTSQEACRLMDPVEGEYHVRVRSRTPGSSVTVIATLAR